MIGKVGLIVVVTSIFYFFGDRRNNDSVALKSTEKPNQTQASSSTNTRERTNRSPVTSRIESSHNVNDINFLENSIAAIENTIESGKFIELANSNSLSEKDKRYFRELLRERHRLGKALLEAKLGKIR